MLFHLTSSSVERGPAGLASQTGVAGQAGKHCAAQHADPNLGLTLVSRYFLQRDFHVKATHPALYARVSSDELAVSCNTLVFPDLWLELKEGENIPPAVLF